PLKPPRPISIPVPGFGTGVPSTHPEAAAPPQAVSAQAPVIPPSARLPEGLVVPSQEPAPPPEAPHPEPAAAALPYVSKRPTTPRLRMQLSAVEPPPASPPPSAPKASPPEALPPEASPPEASPPEASPEVSPPPAPKEAPSESQTKRALAGWVRQ